MYPSFLTTEKTSAGNRPNGTLSMSLPTRWQATPLRPCARCASASAGSSRRSGGAAPGGCSRPRTPSEGERLLVERRVGAQALREDGLRVSSSMPPMNSFGMPVRKSCVAEEVHGIDLEQCLPPREEGQRVLE